jgi:hypothetical protein
MPAGVGIPLLGREDPELFYLSSVVAKADFELRSAEVGAPGGWIEPRERNLDFGFDFDLLPGSFFAHGDTSSGSA